MSVGIRLRLFSTICAMMWGICSAMEPAPALEHRGIEYVGVAEVEPIELIALVSWLREHGLHRVYLGIFARGEAGELPWRILY